MKKLLLIILALFLGVNSSFAAQGGKLKNFYAYTVVGHGIREVGPAASRYIDRENDQNTTKIKDADYTWYYTDKKTNETYYFRCYPANQDTNIYVVGNAEYDKNYNGVTQFCKSNGYSYQKLKDKDALREYKFDFYDLARKDALGGFFIAPDCIKPLKNCMAKINEKMAKNSKKNSVVPYSPDTDPIKLTLVDSVKESDPQIDITMTRNEYRLKQKENKYAHAYEYVVKNNSNNSICLKSVACERLASTKDIVTEAYVDLDRVDLVDTVGSFAPVVVCTCGLSMLCCVPNWVRLARVTKETMRYTKLLPSNYTINGNGSMRILVLKFKNNVKPLNFVFDKNGTDYRVSF